MKKIVLLAFVLIFLLATLSYALPYTNIDVDTAYNMIISVSYPQLLVLDVRTKGEYDSGHVYGAIWIPHTELEARLGELDGHENHVIIVYCRSGVRSVIASEILDSHNFTKVYNMLGGIQAWQSAGYPVWISTIHNVNTTFNYDTIQMAINAPQTLDGHTIFVEEGTYYEHVVVNKSLSLIGENRSNTIIDGTRCGHAIQVEADNVSITGLTITNSSEWPYIGLLVESKNCTISGNNIISNYYGIYLSYSSGNHLRDNVISNNTCNFAVWGQSLSGFMNDVDISNTVNGKPVYYWIGERDRAVPTDAGYVALVNCTNITVKNLNLANNMGGVLLAFAKNTKIGKSNITRNEYGIWLYHSSNNAIFGNNITASQRFGSAIELWDSSNNTVSRNNITDNSVGIWLSRSSSNTIAGNWISNNSVSILLVGSLDNSVSGNNITDNDACGIQLEDSSNYNSITRNSITDSNEYGICLSSWPDSDASNNSISGNIVSRNGVGIQLHWHSNFNVISENSIEANRWGIVLSGSYNSVYHNNFVDNGATTVHSVDTTWDDGYPSGGNYWSDYDGLDADKDGIGDVPYQIETGNQDNYPLMGMFSSLNTSLGYPVDVISNSTIENFEYFESNSTIKMYVSGEEGFGFCRVTIPHVLMNVSTISVIIDDGLTPVIYHNYSLYDNGTHKWIYFTYPHSIHEIDIIPEFPSFLILPIFMIATLLIIIVHRRKHSM